ncbi:hypothetical protein ACFE04_009799 [Oxalis oulophora]
METIITTTTQSSSDELCMDIDQPVATAEDWRKSLDKVVPAVVVLRTTATRAFDTEASGASYATGFVVDKIRGLILTNRHVVKPGPVVAEAMFVNREEVTVHPVYRDPVHDFGFFRYDPSAVQFLSYEEIPLAPEAACVGLEIRVVGNDSGEKVSILAGTLARLDRDAPHYKKDGYNDFNTFYMQAASGTKGGSSGSPVIDWQGRAVALNAGSKTSSASAFFLPLERVVRALKFLQCGKDSYTDKWEAVSIPRGTLQLTFLHKGFDETRRLGLRSEREQMVRQASPSSETGMLVVDSVVPGGPAHKHLEPGDVLVHVNGEVTTQFLKLETLLDDSVGKNIELEIERGGLPFIVNLVVQDLHSITPDYFLEISGAVIQPLSYQQARNFRFKCGLVYVTEPGYMFLRAGVPRHAIIKKFAGEEITKVEEFISVISKLSRGARIPLEYVSYTDRYRRKSVLVTIDRHEWYAPPKIYSRDDNSGLWTAKPAFSLETTLPLRCVNGGIGQGLSQNLPLNGEYVHDLRNNGSSDGVTSMETSCEDAHTHDESDVGSKKRKVEEGNISSDEILVADGSLNDNTGEAKKLDEVGRIENPASRDYQSATAPVVNGSLAERAIEPTLVMFEGLTSVITITTKLSEFTEPALRRGDMVHLIGLSRSLQATSRKSVVTNPCAALNIGSADSPRYRATNMEVIELDTDFGSTFSGVLTDELGRVQAIWGSFSTQLKFGGNSSEDHQFVRGLPIYAISQVLDKIISGARGPTLLINGVKRSMPLVRVLEVELYPTLLSKARSFGLSDKWVQALVKKDPIRRQVLCVKGCFAGSKAESLLEQADMVLAINKEPVTCFNDIENACQALDKDVNNDDGKLQITIFRQGREIDLVVGTDVRDGNGTTRTINWCGCVVQDPHPAVRALGFLPEEGHGVYVARWCHGSPTHRYGLFALQWIVEVNGKPTPNLDAFARVTKELDHGEFVRVRTVHLNGKPRVMTLKQDLHYWPTWELRFDPDTAVWRRNIIKSLDSSNL